MISNFEQSLQRKRLLDLVNDLYHFSAGSQFTNAVILQDFFTAIDKVLRILYCKYILSKVGM